MDKLVYTALGAASNQSLQRVQLTNDLANVSTIGYKRSITSRPETVAYVGSGFPTRYQAVTPARADGIDLKSGHHMETGVQTDIAMNNSTVLGVQGDDGEIAFTRRGDIRATDSGLLEIGSGQLVLDDGGNPITVPADTVVSIGPNGVVYGQSGLDSTSIPAELGTLMLRDASAITLVRRSDGLYGAAEAALPNANGDFATGPEPVSITVGSLEGSNSDAVEVMVNLLDYYRSFETQMKIVKSTEELDKDGSRMMSVR
jgi:flagellar basal-body rod protein FlgF